MATMHRVSKPAWSGLFAVAFGLLVAGGLTAQEVVAPRPSGAAPRAAVVSGHSLVFETPARLGVFLHPGCPVAPDARGTCDTAPIVTSVVENGPAAEAGILPGDTLLALDGVGLKTEPGRRALSRLRAGIPVTLRVAHAGARQNVRVIPDVRASASFFRTNGSTFGYSYTTAPKPPGEVAVYRFEDDSGEVSEFHFAPAPGAPAPGSPTRARGYVVFREDPSGTLQVDVDLGAPGAPGSPEAGVQAFRLNGERVELAQLEDYLQRQQEAISRLNGDMEVRIERIESDGVEGIERTHLILQNAPLAHRLETVRSEALTDARQKLGSVVRLRAELASRGEVPPGVAVAYSGTAQAPRPSGSGSVAPEVGGDGFFGTLSSTAPVADGRLAGAEFRPLTPALAEYFPVDEGLLVLRVLPETPAARLGLRDGDVVVAVGGTRNPSLLAFRGSVGQMQVNGGKLRVKWNRKGVEMEGDLTTR